MTEQHDMARPSFRPISTAEYQALQHRLGMLMSATHRNSPAQAEHHARELVKMLAAYGTLQV